MPFVPFVVSMAILDMAILYAEYLAVIREQFE